jgi:hypothetical protein
LYEEGTVNLGALRRYRVYIILAGVILTLWAAYEFFWPTYSWENYIDPDDVRLAAIPDGRNAYEVHAIEEAMLTPQGR